MHADLRYRYPILLILCFIGFSSAIPFSLFAQDEALFNKIFFYGNQIHAKVGEKYAYILPDQSIWWAEEGFRLNLED